MRYLVIALALLAASCCLPVLGAGGTITWPASPTPAGGNSALNAQPRLDWVTDFMGRMEIASKMPKVDIVFDGDSITQGWVHAGYSTWLKSYAKRNAMVYGIAGDRIEAMLWRLQNGELDGIHPKIAFILVGTNNLVTIGKSMANTDAEIVEGIKAVVAEYQKRLPDCEIVVMGIFPRAPLASDPIRARIKNINGMLAGVADGKKTLFLDIGDKFLQPDGSISNQTMSDFLHPTATGYQIWVDSINPLIDKYVTP